MNSLPPLFGKFEDYDYLLGGLHRNPVYPLRAPLLTRQLSLWTASPGNNSNHELFDKNRKAAAFYVYGIYRNIQSRFDQNNLDSEITQLEELNIVGRSNYFGYEPDTHGNLEDKYPSDKILTPHHANVRAFAFRWWRGVRVVLRFELHTEFLTISTSLDLSSIDGLGETCPSIIKSLTKQLIDLDLLVTKHRGKWVDSKAVDPPPDLDIREYKPITDVLYFEIWDHFDDSVLRIKEASDIKSAGVFADLRGMILSEPRVTGTEPASRHNFQLPFQRSRGDTAKMKLEGNEDWDKSRWDKDKWKEVHQAFWPMLKSPLDGVVLDRHEFCVDLMLDKQALYVSALGAHHEKIVATDRYFPVCYFVFTRALPGWQIGRLINRLHYLGTLHLAALIGFDALRSAAFILRDGELIMKSVMGKLSEGASPKKPPKNNLGKELKGALSTIENKFNQLDSIRELYGVFEYRIERARYYTAQFRSIVKELRSDRVESFQPYNEFVERRLGAAFEFIEFLGQRYSRLREDRLTLIEYEVSETTSSTQERADIALWAVLVPYYLANIFDHVAHGFTKDVISDIGGSSLIWNIFAIFSLVAMWYFSSRFEWWPKLGVRIMLFLGLLFVFIHNCKISVLLDTLEALL